VFGVVNAFIAIFLVASTKAPSLALEALSWFPPEAFLLLPFPWPFQLDGSGKSPALQSHQQPSPLSIVSWLSCLTLRRAGATDSASRDRLDGNQLVDVKRATLVTQEFDDMAASGDIAESNFLVAASMSACLEPREKWTQRKQLWSLLVRIQPSRIVLGSRTTNFISKGQDGLSCKYSECGFASPLWVFPYG
jgi:hypothetical protein